MMSPYRRNAITDIHIPRRLRTRDEWIAIGLAFALWAACVAITWLVGYIVFR